MQSILNAVKGKAIDLVASVTPVLKESKFRESGMLTPDEFVAAGDHLVAVSPTWCWVKGDPAFAKTYLPEDKQFLITKNVPSHRRCRDMEYDDDNEKIIDDEGGNEGWVDTHANKAPTKPEVVEAVEAKEEAFSEEKEEKLVDMDDFLANLDDDAAEAAIVQQNPDENDQGILQTRTYDLNITYDNYYRTPRLWLSGYDENHKPLTQEELYEDVSQDFAKKTVTFEAHPHLSGPPQASVHPCRHAQAMKSLIETVEVGGGRLEVHMYLIVFLKFLQAVIPTIEYDYTADFNMS